MVRCGRLIVVVDNDFAHVAQSCAKGGVYVSNDEIALQITLKTIEFQPSNISYAGDPPSDDPYSYAKAHALLVGAFYNALLKSINASE
jgi:hypothetical protein